ncbi:MAG: hypothetical protein K8F35_02540 [Dokdonella sp.]|uniref:hypothetical protein n=1 Tax=Dokdonella sp. TaxID=2291710 RepID=UPI0025B9F04E|nr:hypothetical protein [Dokdonella sp.]MBZ0221884.1 hypothetical protein [Dokdonella sp.]
MKMLKTSFFAAMLATSVIGMSYSPTSNAKSVTCQRVTACAGGSCQVYMVCDDGHVYVLVE